MKDCLIEGFIELPDKLYEKYNNIENHRNEVSPFCKINGVTSDKKKFLVVDSYYGQAYNNWYGDPIGIYGITNELPYFRTDSFADLGFLRIPFRRIPRKLIKNRRELESVLKSFYETVEYDEFVFRGQNKEYLLNRTTKSNETLYGDSQALEPSLLPSSGRYRIVLDNLLLEWCMIIQLFLGKTRKELETIFVPSIIENIRTEHDSFLYSMDFLYFSLAIAQHYGLPSSGLDVTNKIDVALFFALNRFDVSPDLSGYDVCSRNTSREPSVIYLFMQGQNRGQIFQNIKPLGFPLSRPNAQNAHFIYNGWGFSKNACAKKLVLALYLDPNGDFDEIPDASTLFPPRLNDPFGMYLESILKKELSEPLKHFLSHFRWIL